MSEKPNKRKWIYYFINKYFIVGLSFVVWMIFFDQNSYLLHRQLNENISNLMEERDYFQSEIQKENEQLEQLENNPEEYERLAREKYLMKKENEDIFVIEIKDSLQHE